IAGRYQTLFGQRRRMQPAGELSYLFECAIELLSRRLQGACDGRVLSGLQLAPGEPQRQGERDESLLRTVVKVPLELPALFVPGLDDACARGTEVVPGLSARHRQGDELAECP